MLSVDFIGCLNVVENFFRKKWKILAKSGVNFVTRTPLIKGVTDTCENIKSIATFLNENGVNYIELLPYNEFAPSKYKSLRLNYKPNYQKTDSESLNAAIKIFNDYKINAIVK